MRVWLTGGTGFVGSNIVHAALEGGHEVLTTVHSFTPPPDAGYRSDRVDMTDADAVRRSIDAFRPDAVVHTAIMNDFGAMYADRTASWDAYVGATRIAATEADRVGASFVVVSTDWVFDGTGHRSDESTPPNPVNLYGVLKLASEMVALERGGAVARVSGVNGLHRTRPESPRHQDPGYGYFVASLVDSLSDDRPYTVWEGDDLNMLATPSLATECGEIIIEIARRRLDGVFHTCGADAVGRMELAMLACEVFGLDGSLVRSGPIPEASRIGAPVPYDTSLATPRTDALLERTATPVRTLLERFRLEMDAA